MTLTLDQARELVATIPGTFHDITREQQAEVYAGMHPDAGRCVACCRFRLAVDRRTQTCADCDELLENFLGPVADNSGPSGPAARARGDVRAHSSLTVPADSSPAGTDGTTGLPEAA